MLNNLRKCFGLFFVFTLASCSQPVSPPAGPTVFTNRLGTQQGNIEGETEITNTARMAQIHYNFGTIICQNQRIHHKFNLNNDTNKEIKIIKAYPLTPCCSSVGPLPESIPPGSSIEVPTSWKTGRQTGNKRIQFMIHTDSPQRTLWRLELQAGFVAKEELLPIDHTERYILIKRGKPGRWVWRVTTHYPEDQERFYPVSVKVTAPLTISFLGPGEDLSLPGGIHQTSRDIEVLLPSTKAEKSGRGELEVQLNNNSSLRDGVSWGVVAPIRAVPAGLVIYPGQGSVTKTIILESEDIPFRITEITNPLDDSSPITRVDQAVRLHRIDLRFDPALATAPSETIHIKTDHPDQEEVTLSVMVLEARRKDNRWNI